MAHIYVIGDLVLTYRKRSSCFNDQNLLVVPWSWAVIYGDRICLTVAVLLQNCRPFSVKASANICEFKFLLKIYVFKSALC